MADLQLTLASLDYLDRTRALIDGSVRPKGIELRLRPDGSLRALPAGRPESGVRRGGDVRLDLYEPSSPRATTATSGSRSSCRGISGMGTSSCTEPRTSKPRATSSVGGSGCPSTR